MIKTNAMEGRRIHRENEVECKAKKPGASNGCTYVKEDDE